VPSIGKGRSFRMSDVTIIFESKEISFLIESIKIEPVRVNSTSVHFNFSDYWLEKEQIHTIKELRQGNAISKVFVSYPLFVKQKLFSSANIIDQRIVNFCSLSDAVLEIVFYRTK
jgi:hypothetical protein